MAPKGAEVTVEEDAGDGWYKVTYGDTEGYMSGEWLKITLADGTVIEAVPTPIDWTTKEFELNGGKVDVLWNGLTITEERQEAAKRWGR